MSEEWMRLLWTIIPIAAGALVGVIIIRAVGPALWDYYRERSLAKLKRKFDATALFCGDCGQRLVLRVRQQGFDVKTGGAVLLPALMCPDIRSGYNPAYDSSPFCRNTKTTSWGEPIHAHNGGVADPKCRACQADILAAGVLDLKRIEKLIA